MCVCIYVFIIPHVKIVRRDWLTKVGHSIMSTGEMSTGKKSTILTGSTGSHCCFHWYFTKLGLVWYNKTNMSCQCRYPDGMSPLGRMVFTRARPSGKPSSLWETFHQDTHTGMAYLHNVCVCACVHVCMCACAYVCMYVCMYVSMYVCMYVVVYVCMHLYIYPRVNAICLRWSVTSKRARLNLCNPSAYVWFPRWGLIKQSELWFLRARPR